MDTGKTIVRTRLPRAKHSGLFFASLDPDKRFVNIYYRHCSAGVLAVRCAKLNDLLSVFRATTYRIGILLIDKYRCFN